MLLQYLQGFDLIKFFFKLTAYLTVVCHSFCSFFARLWRKWETVCVGCRLLTHTCTSFLLTEHSNYFEREKNLLCLIILTLQRWERWTQGQHRAFFVPAMTLGKRLVSINKPTLWFEKMKICSKVQIFVICVYNVAAFALPSARDTQYLIADSNAVKNKQTKQPKTHQ